MPGNILSLALQQSITEEKKGAGKTTYTFSANANVLSANFPFSVLPAGGAGMGQAAEMESTLALAENVYVNLPTPEKKSFNNICRF